MRSKLKNKDGISLISMIMIGVIIVVVVYILIILLKDGIKVLSKAQTARKQTKSNQIIEQVDMILANYNAENATQQKRSSFEDYLKKSKQSGDIANYWYSQNLVIVKYKTNYIILVKDKDSYSSKGLVYIENDEYANLAIKNYEKSIDPQSKEKIKIEDKNTYIISESVRADCYDYTIEDNQNVTIAIVGKVEINNKNLDKPAVKLGYNSSLKLYIYEDTTISSLYNGLGEIKYDQVREKGGYAGINLPETSTLTLYGNKTLRVYGGPAGKGGTYTDQDTTLGSGGGGAGAGIGGNGGSGGKADEKKSNQGGNGENSGDVKITETVELYAYGRSWCKRWRFYHRRCWCRRRISSCWYRRRPELEAGGATKLIGAGGYSGGASIAVNEGETMLGGKDGLAGSHIEDTERYEYYYSGGGYFSGPDGKDSKNKNRAELCLGGFYSIGQDLSTSSATGGTGGNGGDVDLEDYSKLNAYNGNKITDNSSNVPVEINSQNGLNLPKYSYKKVEGKTFLLNRVSRKKKVKTTKFGQGIGSGAGYYEGTNGIYRNKTAED